GCGLQDGDSVRVVGAREGSRGGAAVRALARVSLRRVPPPVAVKLMVPVWGYQHVRQFLETSLPTLLAPGNVPALAAALDCEFIILTSEEDRDYIREHAG